MEVTPCLTCGACCATFRVSFYWSETDPSVGGITPAAYTAPISAHLVAMLGTDCASPHCIALQGEVGKQVSCRIYEQRSSTCRQFDYSGFQGIHNPVCDKARQHHGLSPLSLPIEPLPTH